MPASSTHTTVDSSPSLLWVVIPPVLLLSAYFARKWYLAYRLRVHGIGKGAPGFQTNVKRIRVTPEIAARLRRGEHVSPEEIAAATARAEENERNETPSEIPSDREKDVPVQPEEPVNEWLPETITSPKKRKRLGKKK